MISHESKEVLKGVVTMIPGVKQMLPKGVSGGTNSAEYCYGVWLKHLTLLWANGLRSMPNSVAELGPGDSLGVGLAALLSGVNEYAGLDVVRFSNIDSNLKILDDLVELFRARAGRPKKGWPDFDSHLDQNLFPSHILTEERLGASLTEPRINAIRDAIKHPGQRRHGVMIRYFVPWYQESVIEPNSVDLVLSHGSLQYVPDLDGAYQALYAWLKPGGVMTHQYPLDSLGAASVWNGHLAYSEWQWKLISGKRMVPNRHTHTEHLAFINKNGFSVQCSLRNFRSDGLSRSQLAPRWQSLPDDDLHCCGALVQAIKQSA